MRVLFAAAALLAGLTSAQTLEVQAEYPQWAQYANYWQYAWEPVELTMSDGMTLTAMRVLGSNAGRKKPTGNTAWPILVLSPQYTDPQNNLYEAMVYQPTDIQTPTTLQLVDAGHDVYFLFSRGSMYSQTHSEYDVHSQQFWDFTPESQGTGDFAEVIDALYERTGQKISIFSQVDANIAILAGAALDPTGTYASKVESIGMLIPCRVQTTEANLTLNNNTIETFRERGIYELGGPTWFQTIPKLAKYVGRSLVRDLTLGEVGIKYRHIGLAYQDAFMQNTVTNRFQRYIDSETFWNSGPDAQESEEIDLSGITGIEFGLFRGDGEVVCSAEQNDIIEEQLGDNVTFSKSYPELHRDIIFSYVQQDFINDVKSFFSISSVKLLQ